MTRPPLRKVGVFPAVELERRRTLFEVLEQAYPVRFEGRPPGELRDLDAAVELWGSGQARAAAEAGIPALSMVAPEPGERTRVGRLSLSTALGLDPRLRGAELRDSHLGEAVLSGAPPEERELAPSRREAVLATCGGLPFWTREGSIDQALLAPAELEPGEPLRQRLCDGRCAALLPLVHLLRDLTDGLRWCPPSPRAAFLLDDPNLHWPSYGFIKLDELVDHAREQDYHLALAMIPLDGWFAHPKAVRALAGGGGALSLCVHGNDHNGGELGRPATEAEALELAAQALRRVEAFEQRSGVGVDRIMAPPHEACSEQSVRALLRCGFDAISMTRPFPWAAPPAGAWLAQPAGTDPLVGWRPADFIAGGLPLLLRHPLAQRSATELRLRAFLDQPLILYGHHGDLEGGLAVLADAAADVNALRTTRWSSLGEIAAGSYETRRDTDLLRVRLLTRRARVEIPLEAERLLIELPPSHEEPMAEQLSVDGRPLALAGRATEPFAVRPGASVMVALRHTGGIDFHTVQPRRPRPLALARRVAGEGRDRVQPLLARAR
jgi:hypothetical protein